MLTRMLAHIGEENGAEKARLLLEQFGSFSGVLEAPGKEIHRCGIVSEQTGAYLLDLHHSAVCYMEDRAAGISRVYDPASARAILEPKFMGRKREAVALLLLDGRGRVIYNGIVNEGAVSEVPIYIRRLVELCLQYDANEAILAHNHPSGNPAPSRNDIVATRDVQFALAGIDVDLKDHMIFAGGDYLSLKQSDWLDRIKEDVDTYRDSIRNESLEQEQVLFSGAGRGEDVES